MTPDWLHVIQRPFPSAVLVVVPGPQTIVVDPGSLTDADELPAMLADAGDSLGTPSAASASGSPTAAP